MLVKGATAGSPSDVTLQEYKADDTKRAYLYQSMDQWCNIPPIIVLADANNYVWQLRVLRLHNSWWRHQMETFSVLRAICAGNSPVTGEFPAQSPLTRSFYILFDLRLNKRLSKQSSGLWFETPWRSLWYQCNVKSNSEYYVSFMTSIKWKWPLHYPVRLISNLSTWFIDKNEVVSLVGEKWVIWRTIVFN